MVNSKDRTRSSRILPHVKPRRNDKSFIEVIVEVTINSTVGGHILSYIFLFQVYGVSNFIDSLRRVKVFLHLFLSVGILVVCIVLDQQ